MATLSPKALIELWNKMLNEGRKTGFGMKNSDAFIKKINDDYDIEFDKKSKEGSKDG